MILKSPATVDGFCFRQNSRDFLRKVPSSEEHVGDDGSGGRTRRTIGDLDRSPTRGGFPDSPARSWEGGSSRAEMVVGGGETSGMEGVSRSAYVSHGLVSVIGRRRAMEDAIVVVPELGAGELSFFAVYDGHGGARVSKTCEDKLHQFLLEEIKATQGEVDWEIVMGASFRRMDDEVVDSGTEEDEDEDGSSATVAVVGNEVVVVANCGDSRAVMCCGGDAVALSRDHKVPDQPDEKERVEASGGRVNSSRLYRVLTNSRPIGDKYLKPYVTSDPEVTVTKRVESDQFLLIASNGLWDVLSNKVACDIVMKCLSGKMDRSGSEKSNEVSAAAAKLAELAIAKGSKDNVSIIVVELNESN